jgi:hypothetical protein
MSPKKDSIRKSGWYYAKYRPPLNEHWDTQPWYWDSHQGFWSTAGLCGASPDHMTVLKPCWRGIFEGGGFLYFDEATGLEWKYELISTMAWDTAIATQEWIYSSPGFRLPTRSELLSIRGVPLKGADLPVWSSDDYLQLAWCVTTSDKDSYGSLEYKHHMAPIRLVRRAVDVEL